MHYLDAILEVAEWSQFLSKANHWTSQLIEVYALITDAKEAEVNWFHENLQEFGQDDTLVIANIPLKWQKRLLYT